MHLAGEIFTAPASRHDTERIFWIKLPKDAKSSLAFKHQEEHGQSCGYIQELVHRTVKRITNMPWMLVYL